MPDLRRGLGTGDAVVIGLSAMIGAGLYGAFAPAAGAAGSALTIGLALAAMVAFCNASSSAALAARYPSAGGTYVYGRERLGPLWGYLAGWGFVLGKTASCAAMALTAAAYLFPQQEKLAAAGFVVLLGAVNYIGISRTARTARVLLVLTLLLLAVTIGAIWSGGGIVLPRAWPGFEASAHDLPGYVQGIAQSAGLLFFAFAGYARIATLGEEVRTPARTIPRAIPIALGIVVGLYFLVAATLLAALGPAGLARSSAPLADAARAGTLGWLAPAANLGAGVAALGALLALLAGVGRTALAMAREHDLPAPLAAVHPRFATPHRAELVIVLAVVCLILVTDLRETIGFSSFGVLLYYAIANASAYTLDRTQRWFPRALPGFGLAGCLVLACTLPWVSVLGGVACFTAGGFVWFARAR